jgi:hypothetical protein
MVLLPTLTLADPDSLRVLVALMSFGFGLNGVPVVLARCLRFMRRSPAGHRRRSSFLFLLLPIGSEVALNAEIKDHCILIMEGPGLNRLRRSR